VDLTDDVMLEMLRRMLRIRYFDERVAELTSAGLIPGGVHTSIGHEAAVVGACMAVRGDDYMTGYHRSHGHPIGKGAAVKPLMAELFGKATGVCRGKGGSMHLADFSVGSLGESGIVGAGLPIAVGAGLSAKMRASSQVCLCFFGDGAANSGPFHEALNLASIWDVPVVFVCENNGYAVTFAIKDAMAVENVADRAAAYAMPGVTVDGQDILAVHEAVCAAVGKARSGQGPSLIEAKTYRYREHSEMGALKLAYRPEDEIERWQQRDPVRLFVERLLADGVLDKQTVEELESATAHEVDDAVTFAQTSPFPDPEEAFDNVFAEAGESSSPGVGTPARGTKPDGCCAQHKPRRISYLDATMEAIADEMRRDERVFFMGEDIREKLFGSIPVDEFDDDRVRNTPISEAGFVGTGIGAAMTGLRPVIQMGFATLLYSAMDQVVNQAAKLRYMSGGQAQVPLVLLAPLFYAGGVAAHHSDRPFVLFANSPGLKIVSPSTPRDMKGLMVTAIRENDPVVVFADGSLWGTKGEVDPRAYAIPLGQADIKRQGDDVTIVAIAGAVRLALRVAKDLEKEGLSVEVVDPMSLVPLDYDTILGSVSKTGRLVVVDPGPRMCGFASEIITGVVERTSLRAAPVRVTASDVPTPFSPPLERHTLPDAAKVKAAVARVTSSDPAHVTMAASDQ
jgi:2-oxoisovalerate dehydrogenase E1 component